MMSIIQNNINFPMLIMVPIRNFGNYKKTTCKTDFMGNKTSEKIEYSNKNTEIKYSNKKTEFMGKRFDNERNNESLINVIVILINAGIKEWNSNPILRKKVIDTTIVILDSFKQILIGPSSDKKNQYERVENYEQEKRILDNTFSSGSTNIKIAEKLGIKKFPASSHEILGLVINHSKDDLKEQYYKLAKKWHPDNTQDSKELHTLIFNEIKNAYDNLKNKK